MKYCSEQMGGGGGGGGGGEVVGSRYPRKFGKYSAPTEIEFGALLARKRFELKRKKLCQSVPVDN